jgi:branched-chain amino acid transport system substrate-binding protein
MLRRTLLAASAATLAAPSILRAQTGPLAIACAGPLTGPNASFGAQMRAGAEAAVADLNAAGGVGGRQLALQLFDDASDPRQGVSVANQIASRRIPFVAGHFNSGVSIPASNVYAEEGVVQISPASTNPTFTERNLWNVARVCGRDDQQGQVAGAYILANFRQRRVAILHDNTPYGKGLADETKKTINAGGMTEAVYEAITTGERDFSAVISRLKAANVDVIYFGGLHTEAGLIVRQSREQGLNAVLISGDGIVTQEFWQITGPAGEGTLMTFSSDPRRRPSAAQVVAAMRARNVDPEGYVLYTYAAIQVWAQAAARANTTDARRVAAALKAQGNSWNTVLGPISFDAKGDVTVPDYVFYIWRNGTYAELS